MALTTGFGRWRRVGGAAEGLLASLVVVALVAAITYAATRPAARATLDLTREDVYSLTPQTRAVLAGLETPVELVSILQPESGGGLTGLPEVQRKAADYVNTFLGQYVQASGGRVSLRVLDPHRDRVAAEQIMRRWHLTNYNVVLVEGATRTEQVFLEELVTIDRGLGDPDNIQRAALRALHAEGPLTTAVLSVTSAEPPVVGFLAGYGGPRIDGFDVFDLGLLAEGVRGQGLRPAIVGPEPEAADLAGLHALVICGPQVDPGPRVLDAIGRWWSEGGRLLIAVDPTLASPGVDALLREVGVAREAAVLCRLDVPEPGPDRALLAVHRFNADQAIAAPIAAQGTFARVYAMGGLARHRDAPPERLVEVVCSSSGEVFGDAVVAGRGSGDWALGDGERPGSRVLGLACSGGAGGRAVVFGGSAFLTNGFLTSESGAPANMELGLHSVNWLLERASAIDVGPRPVWVSRVDLLEDELETIQLYVLLVMPLGGAALGLLVWFARRR